MTKLSPQYQAWRRARAKAKPIPGWPGYFVTANGLVLSEIRNKQVFLKPTVSRGYHRIVLYRNKKKTRKGVHACVLEAFVGPRPKGHQTGHLNGKRSDNRVENLAWVTPRENTDHRYKHGTIPTGEKHNQAKLTDAVVLEARAIYARGNTLIRELSARHGVSEIAMRLAIRGITWSHLPGSVPLSFKNKSLIGPFRARMLDALLRGGE